MASTVTSTPSDLTLTAGAFTSTKKGTISWTAPTVPDGATIKSCVLTGKATASSTSVSSIKINNQSITVSTSGYNFTIDLGTDTSKTSVEAIMTKSGSSWSSRNVKFTNMTYTVTYDLVSVTYTVTFKNEDGSVIKTEKNVSSGTRVSSIEPTISKTGYTFLGWYDEQGNEVTRVTSDVVLTARFQKNPILTVTQNSGGYIVYNNTRYEGSFTLEVSYGGDVDFEIYANDGYYIRIAEFVVNGFEHEINENKNYVHTSIGYNNIRTDEEFLAEYARVDGTEETPTTPSTSHILIGNNRVNKIYIGDTNIFKVFLGDIKLFDIS